MPDNVDFIQEQQAELLERQINAARGKHCGVSALVCEECDAPIPAARRAAYPSATRCVYCQSVFEAKTSITGEWHEYSYRNWRTLCRYQ